MIKRLLCLLWLPMAVLGAPLDEAYYAERLKWHRLDTAFVGVVQPEFFEWPEGQFMRLVFDQKQSRASLWLSDGDGLFRRIEPVKREGNQWLYARRSNGRAMIWLQNPDNDPVSIHHSSIDRPPLLDVETERLLHEDNQVDTDQSDGHQNDSYNRLEPDDVLELTLQGPAEYAFVHRIRWQADYGLSQWMDLAWQLDEQPWQRDAVKMQVEADYLLQTDRCECVYSRPYATRVKVPEGEHRLRIKADKTLLGHWRLANQNDEQYLFSHNARHDYQGFSAPQPQSEPDALSFHRPLSPMELAQFKAIKPLPVRPKGRFEADERWWPNGHYPAIAERPYVQSQPADSWTFPLPANHHRTPLRLRMVTAEQPARLTLQSDRGEVVELAYFPERVLDRLRLASDLPARLHNAANLTPNLATIAQQSWVFDKPFRQVTVSVDSESPVTFELAYRQASLRRSDVDSFRAQVDSVVSGQIRRALFIGTTAHIEVPLLREETKRWIARLGARSQSFSRLYGLPEQGFEQDVLRVMKRLHKRYQVAVDDLPSLANLMRREGQTNAWRKLVARLASQPPGIVQSEAEGLMLADLHARERWLDVESYWSFRLKHYHDQAAVAAIAKALLKQGADFEAQKWQWLAKRSELPRPQAGWQAYRDMTVQGAARSLVHNKGLQSFFSTYSITAGQTAKLKLAEAGRYRLSFYAQKAGPWHRHDHLSIRSGRGERRYWLESFTDSANLHRVALVPGTLAGPKSIVFDVQPDELDLQLLVDNHDGLIGLQRWHTHTQAPEVMAQPQDAEDLLEQQGAVVQKLYMRLDNQPVKTKPGEVFQPNAAPEPTPVMLTLYEQANTEQLLAGNWQDENHLAAMLLRMQMMEKPLAQALVSRANEAVAAFEVPSSTLLRRLRAVNQDYSWQSLDSVRRSPGTRLQALPGWQAGSPAARWHQALLTRDIEPQQWRLGSASTTVYELQTNKTRYWTVHLQQIARLLDKPATIAVDITHNDKRETVVLGHNQSSSLKLKLRPGDHKIRLAIAETQADESGVKPWVFYNIQGKGASIERQRRYKVATTAKPLVMFVPPHSWLRIEQDGMQRMQYVAEAGELELPANPQTGHSIYRVYRWAPEQSKSLPDFATEAEDRHIVAERPDPALDWPSLHQRPWRWFDRYPLGEQQAGTWGFSYGRRVRQNADEDAATKERFNQLFWHYRHRFDDIWQDDRLFVQHDLGFRQHDDNGLQTLVWQNYGQWISSRYIDFEGRLNYYHQLKADDPAVEGVDAWYGALGVNWKQYWEDDVTNKVNLTIFSRHLDDFPLTGAFDDDLSSPYKRAHRRGARLSDTWTWAPWLDSRLRLFAGVASNEDFNLLEPDNWTVRVGWRQYYQPFNFQWDLTRRGFRGDDERAFGAQRSSMRLALGWDHWRALGQLWRLDAFIRTDLDRGDSAFGLQIHFNHTDGQGWNDFAPARFGFAPLRRRHSYETLLTNEVAGDSHQ